jgi:hypothetical protein
MIIAAESDLLDALTVSAGIQIVHRVAHKAAWRKLLCCVHVVTLIVSLPCSPLKTSALCTCRDSVPKAAAPLLVAQCTLSVRRIQRCIIAQLARVCNRARRPHIHTQGTLLIGRKADPSKPAVHAIEACVHRRIRARVHEIEIEVHRRAIRCVHLRNIHVPDAGRLACIGPNTSQVGPHEL